MQRTIHGRDIGKEVRVRFRMVTGKGHTVGQGSGEKLTGLVRGKKERGLENDTGQENNKLNGNKINETGYKPDWERTTIGTRWKLENTGWD